MDEINWSLTDDDRTKIKTITDRAVKQYAEDGVKIGHQDTQMDLAATHLNGCPLDLDRLLEFDSFNLAHDITGINRHLNRETGRLENHFRPRCAARVSEAA